MLAPALVPLALQPRHQYLREHEGHHEAADDALARDPQLVLLRKNASEQRKWLGPSMCAQHNASSPRGWRNVVVGDLIQQLSLRHVHVQPFEQTTRDRWDYHSSAVWNNKLKRWASDCTDLCYSPSFWELSFHVTIIFYLVIHSAMSGQDSDF